VQIVGCWKRALTNAMEYFTNIEDISVLDESDADSDVESEGKD
jgi:hypothetical protein